MKQTRDLGALLLAATLLLLCVGYLTQCSRATHRPEVLAAATATLTPAAAAESEEERERERKGRPQSIREHAAEEEREERAKVQGISRALQTAGANPEFRRTYGFPP